MIPLHQRSGELVELPWGIPGCCHPSTPGISRIPAWLRDLALKGLGLGWVFTVTTKARLCGTFLGNGEGNPPQPPPEGTTELCKDGMQPEEENPGRDNPCPLPAGILPAPEVRKRRHNHGSAPGLIGSLEGSPNRWKDPGLKVFLCSLDPQD